MAKKPSNYESKKDAIADKAEAKGNGKKPTKKGFVPFTKGKK